MEGPDGCYVFDGLSQPDAAFKGNSIKTHAKGYRRLTFQDGTVIMVGAMPLFLILSIHSVWVHHGVCSCFL